MTPAHGLCRLVALCIFLINPVVLMAQDAATLFANGAYLPAAEAARLLNSADGDALAARATLTYAAYEAQSRAQAAALIATALVDARRGQRRDPHNIQALLQEAVAIGYTAKLKQSPSQAKKAKGIIVRARGLAPRDGLVTLALATWNGEPIADLGVLIAKTVLGARLQDVIKYYDLSLRLEPDNCTFPVFYAFNLYRIDAKRYAAQSQALLEKAITLPARDAFQTMIRDQAILVLEAIHKKNNSQRTSLLIRRHQPFGAILAQAEPGLQPPHVPQ